MSVSAGAGAATMFTLETLKEELRVLRNTVRFLAQQRESDAKSSGLDRIEILSAISSLRQDIAALPILGREIRALETTVAALQAQVRTRH